MLPAMVITLREGLEAALIVGIVAAFLKQRGRGDALRWVWAGVVLAIGVCCVVAVALRELGQALPQAQQEGLETIVGCIAIAAVSYMVFWMRRNARGLKRELERSAAQALARGSVAALVGMAFLAVIREGFETSVFLLAIFQSTTAPLATSIGAIVGLIIATLIGWGIYRGGIVVNLAKVFRATGCVLALVAGGLAANVMYAGHEAGWINVMLGQAVDLRWLIHPGTPFAALMAGLLGVQPQPTIGEALAYIVVAGTLLVVVVAPPQLWRHRLASRSVSTSALAVLAVAVAALALSACGSSSSTNSASGAAGGHDIAVKLTDAGCSPNKVTAPAGQLNFNVSNGGTGAVTELEVLDNNQHIIGERENVVAGLNGTFSLSLDAGTYTLNCPGGDHPHGTLVVTGTTPKSTPHQYTVKAVKAYRAYLLDQSNQLVAATKQCQQAINSGSLASAQAAYPKGRVFYERIEPVAESFGDLDPRIDARINDPHPGQWTGFHAIEQRLFQKKTLAGTPALAAQLVSDATTLNNKIKTIKLQPAQLANGATDLLDEVATSKITGEEERYSHIDLLDFQANLDGAQEAAQLLYPQLQAEGHKQLVTTLETQFANVQRALGPYHKGPNYELYTALTHADTQHLAHVVNALAEPLSGVSAYVA